MDLFRRIDILVKTGSHLDLIEVKAKSYHPEDTRFTRKGSARPLKVWAPYLYDVTFQRYVLANSYQTNNVDCHLMMANKVAVCATDGLNTKFKLDRDGSGRKRVTVSDSLTQDDLAVPILGTVCVNDLINYIYEEEDFNGHSFEHYIGFLSKIYKGNTRTQGNIGSICKTCQFKSSSDEEESGLIRGYKECWLQTLG